VTYPDAQVLDVTGPLEVFSRSARWLRDEGRTRGLCYEIELLAREPGPVRMSSGLELVASSAYRDAGEIDTLLIGGGIGAVEAARDRELLDWVREREPRVSRLASICTGATVLAAAGLLDGREATTHWSWCERTARDYPAVTVQPDALYVKSGKIWTSAGVTAGMDLALAMVEEDWGRDVALETARELVMFLKRPGGQSQFSSHLAAQEADRDQLRDLQRWILDHFDADLCVERLADRVHMSPRNFARMFVRETGRTPAKFVEVARVDEARRRLEESELPVTAIARDCGFGSAETMRRTFQRRLRVVPRDYRLRFRTRA
jgi:transcriptional regulator GlxA family with amidase domain